MSATTAATTAGASGEAGGPDHPLSRGDAAGETNMSNPIPNLERPETFDGQRLEAADFTAIFAHPRGIRWLHNRTLHGWGIAAGFDVDAARGERFVTVSPGYAIDCQGRDLIGSEPVTLAVPQVGGERHFLLTVSYLEDLDLPVAESRAGVCLPDGAVRRPERPRLRWQQASDADFDPGIDVPLVEVTVKDCRVAKDPDRSVCRDLTQRLGPYVSQGTSARRGTNWRRVTQGGMTAGVSATIDTTAGAFRRTPQYFVTLMGDRISAQPFWFILDGPITITDASARTLDVTVWLPSGAMLGTTDLNPLGTIGDVEHVVNDVLEWTVAWIGVES
jgi:hypothetical protein